MSALFYDNNDIFWVYDTCGADRLARDLEAGVFSADHVDEVAKNLYTEADPELAELVLPYANFSQLPQWVERLNTYEYWRTREMVLEVNPAASAVLGPPLAHASLEAQLLMVDLDNYPEQVQQLLDAQDPALRVLTEPSVLDNTLRQLNNPPALNVILERSITSKWSHPEMLAVVLQYAPKNLVETKLVEMLRAAQRSNGQDHPTKSYTPEDMFDLLLPYVSNEVMEQWANANAQEREKNERNVLLKHFEVPLSDGPFADVVKMVEARRADNPMPLNSVAVFPSLWASGFSGQRITDGFSPQQNRALSRQEQIRSIVNPIRRDYSLEGVSGVRNNIVKKVYTTDQINAVVYLGLTECLPLLVKTGLEFVDWSNQFARESLRVALTMPSDDNKHQMCQNMIIAKEAEDLKGRLSAQIPHKNLEKPQETQDTAVQALLKRRM